MAHIASARKASSPRKADLSLRRYSWAIGMQYPLELGELSRMSHFGTGIGKELQVPEWDFKSTIDTKPLGRLFLQKSPRDVFTVELKREMVDNDRKLKSSMTRHRKEMQKESQLLEREMRNHEKPYVCYRGNIKSRFGDKFNNLPSSLRARQGSSLTQTTNTAAPMTVVDAETVVSEQYVVCKRCKKTYKESGNTETSCRYHHGPIIAVFGGMCQNCGMLDYTSGCVVGFHTRKKQRVPRTRKAPIQLSAADKVQHERVDEDEGIQT
ncbi:uncharacterized protein LOC120334394 isoform X1 [Styela clava]